MRADVNVTAEGWNPLKLSRQNPAGVQHGVIAVLKEFGAREV